MKLLTMTFLLFTSFCLLGQTDNLESVSIRDTKKIKAILQIFKEKRMQDSIEKAEKERALELEQNPYHFYYYDETAYDENGNLKYNSEVHIDYKINPTKVDFEFYKSWGINVASIDTLGTFIPMNYALIDTLYLINNLKFNNNLKLDTLWQDEFIEAFAKVYIYNSKKSLMLRHLYNVCDDLILKNIVVGISENKKLKKDLGSKHLRNLQICVFTHKNSQSINVIILVKKIFRHNYYYL
jgi:hypothetical protein